FRRRSRRAQRPVQAPSRTPRRPRLHLVRPSHHPRALVGLRLREHLGRHARPGKRGPHLLGGRKGPRRPPPPHSPRRPRLRPRPPRSPAPGGSAQALTRAQKTDARAPTPPPGATIAGPPPPGATEAPPIHAPTTASLIDHTTGITTTSTLMNFKVMVAGGQA